MRQVKCIDCLWVPSYFVEGYALQYSLEPSADLSKWQSIKPMVIQDLYWNGVPLRDTNARPNGPAIVIQSYSDNQHP